MPGRHQAHPTKNIDGADIVMVRERSFSRLLDPLFDRHLVFRVQLESYKIYLFRAKALAENGESTAALGSMRSLLERQTN